MKKRFSLFNSLALLIILLLFTGTGEEYKESSFREYTAETENIASFRYLLYEPSSPVPGMPLIVYLHGRSGKGEETGLITSVDGFPEYVASGKLGNLRSYVLIPQLPSSVSGWIKASEDVGELVESIAAAYEIDRNNISLTGHSMGGSGVWKFALRAPELYARFAPLSGSVVFSEENVERLKDLKIRAFVGALDTVVPPSSSIMMVEALEEAGGDAALTVYDDADHFAVPGRAFLENTVLIEWLTGEAAL